MVFMERYKNSGGDSGILSYENGTDFIKVKFTDGVTYLYTYDSAGSRHIEQMKTLAVEGSGLNTYINKYTKFKFQSRI